MKRKGGGPSLIDIALEMKPRGLPGIVGLDAQEVDLAMAWIEGTVSISQAAAALQTSSNNAHTRLKTVIFQALRAGVVKLVKAKEAAE